MPVKAKVVVLRPVLQFVQVHTQDALNHMKQHCRWHTEITFCPNDYDDIFLAGTQIVHKARNGLVKAALMHKTWTHALFVDDDMTFPSESLEKLVHYDKDVIGVSYLGKAPPHDVNVFYKRGDQFFRWSSFRKPGPPVEVDGVGFGFVLVKREVFEKLGSEVFHFGKYAGEDLAFCQRAKEAGFGVWVDTRLEVGHVGQFVYNRHFLENYSLTSDQWLADRMRKAMDSPKTDRDEIPEEPNEEGPKIFVRNSISDG